MQYSVMVKQVLRLTGDNMYHIKGKEVSEEEYLHYASKDLRKELYIQLIKLSMMIVSVISGCILYEALFR